MFTLSHLGDCKSLVFQDRFVWCAEISNYLFNEERHTLLKRIFPLAVWGCQKIWNLVFSWSLWIKFLFPIQSKNTEQWSLCDVHTSNPEGNIRGSCIWSAWFLWVFLPFYCISLSREYYLYEIIFIWFQFVKWKECVRQSVLKRSGIWSVIESIPSQLIYVIWWETSVVQFVQRKWRMFTLSNHSKKSVLNEAVQRKAKFGFPCLMNRTWGASPNEGGWRECLAVEWHSLGSVWTAWFVGFPWQRARCAVCETASWVLLCPQASLVTAVFSVILKCACCFLNRSEARNHSVAAPGS